MHDKMTVPGKRIIATAIICFITAMFIHMKARMSVRSQVLITIIPLAIILMSPMLMAVLCGAGGLFEIATAPNASETEKSQ